MEDDKDIMTATDDNKTYVASFSLDERLEKTEKMIEDLQNTMKHERIYRYIERIIIGAIVLFLMTIIYVKWDTVMFFIQNIF